jgi:hypothetical protein
MQGYQGGDGEVGTIGGTIYRTGDVAALDDDGYLTYVGPGSTTCSNPPTIGSARLSSRAC